MAEPVEALPFSFWGWSEEGKGFDKLSQAGAFSIHSRYRMAMTDTNHDTLARNRFFAISALRIAGALLIMAGLVIATGRFESMPRAVGVMLVIVGALDFALVPKLLARRWRTPK